MKCTRLGSAGKHHESYYLDGVCLWCQAKFRTPLYLAFAGIAVVLALLAWKWGLMPRGISIVAP